MGDVTWSLMAPRASDKVDEEADGSTAACVNVDVEKTHQPTSAAETVTTEMTTAGDCSDVGR